MKKTSLILLFFVLGIALYGQTQWYFGDRAGITFNPGATPGTFNPTATPIPSSSLNTFEGTSVVIDPQGDLVFYTDGVSIWDDSHTVINSGTPLLGHPSSTHSAIITPKPGACDSFYVFTVDCYENNFANGLRVTTVVRNGNSISLVPTETNILLVDNVTEKMALTENPDGGYWVVVHDLGYTFYSFPVTFGTTINTLLSPISPTPSTPVTPVSSTVGSFNLNTNFVAMGQMTFSPDGTKLATVTHQPGYIGVFHFDLTTGVVSLPNNNGFGELLSAPASGFNSMTTGFGVAFSPNGNVLYSTISDGTDAQIVQLDLTNSNWTTNDPQTLPTIPVTFNNTNSVSSTYYPLMGMKLGPDGVIYVSRINQPFVAGITNPNNLAGATYVDNILELNPTAATNAVCRVMLPDVTVGCNSTPNPCANDLTAPTILCPQNISVDNDLGVCGAAVVFAPTASDSCSAVTLTTSHTSGSIFPVGTTTVTVTATDASGNIATCDFTVTVADTEKPQASCVDMIVMSDANACGAIVNYDITTSDNCGVDNVTYNPVSGSFMAVGLQTVEVEVKDIYGNVSTCSFVVEVLDNVAPVIAGCGDIVVAADAGACSATVTYNHNITDNCGISSIDYSILSGSVFPVGTTAVDVEVYDFAGNMATCSFNVTVEDTQLPVINCPGNMTVVGTNLNNVCSGVVTFNLSATDNCAIDQITSVPASGSIFPDGVTTVQVTAIDIHGNVQTCSFDVNVVCSYPPIYEVENDTINCEEACTCCGNTPKVCIPLVANSAVPNGIIGMDFCMSYDPALVRPTGNATLGPVVLSSTLNPQTDADFVINTQFTNPGELRVSIFYTGSVYNFTGAGDIICVEFEMLPAFTSGQSTCFGICELIESYNTNILFSSATTGCLHFEDDDNLEGRVIFWDKQNRPLDDTPTADIYGTDANCQNTVGPVAQTDALGYFNYNIANGTNIQIEREIGAANVMSIVNGYDCNLTSLVTTVNNIYFPNAYQMIAMDVNMDGNVSAGDITLMQQRIVLTTTDYNPQGVDWRFTDVPTADTDPSYQISTNFPSPDAFGGYYRFNVPHIPECMPVQVTLNGTVCAKIDSQEFRGVLLGDVSGNWSNTSNLRTYTVDEIVFDLTLATKDPITCAVNIPVYYMSANNLLSIDFEMDYNQSDVQIVNVSKDFNAPTNMMMMYNNYQQDKLMLTSYLNGSMNGINQSGTPIFWIQVQTPATNQTQVTNAMLGNITAYLNGEVATATIVGTLADCNNLSTDIDAPVQTSVQAFPQPSGDLLTLTYGVDVQTLALYDVQGKWIQSISVNSDGKSQVDMSKLANGVYVLQINDKFSRKIIK